MKSFIIKLLYSSLPLSITTYNERAAIRHPVILHTVLPLFPAVAFCLLFLTFNGSQQL